MAKLTDDGVEPVLVTLTPSNDIHYVQGIQGRWPDAAWASYTNGSLCASSSRVRRIEAGQWKPAFAQDGTGVTALALVHAFGGKGNRPTKLFAVARLVRNDRSSDAALRGRLGSWEGDRAAHPPITWRSASLCKSK